MKKVLSNGITSSSQQPYTKKTHEWYNSMASEAAEALVKALIPASAYTGKLVILSGCKLTGTNPGARTVSGGWVWYDGEIFRVNADSFTTSGSEIGVWSIDTTSTNLTFSDSASKPVHQERTFVISNGLAGSGLFDEDESVSKGPYLMDYAIVAPSTFYTGTGGVGLAFPNKQSDTMNWYNTTTGIFNPKAEGYYQLTVQLNVRPIAITENTQFDVHFQKNGSGSIQTFSYGTHFVSDGVASGFINNAKSISLTKILYFNGDTDYVGVIYAQYSGDAATEVAINGNLAISRIF